MEESDLLPTLLWPVLDCDKIKKGALLRELIKILSLLPHLEWLQLKIQENTLA
jgi:hypothetical protein